MDSVGELTLPRLGKGKNGGLVSRS
jgi:hypothetical protein